MTDGSSSGENLGWIGKVPSHWEIVAIKWLTPVKRGASPRPIDDPIYFDADGEWAWVRIADVSSAGVSGVLRSTSQTLSELGSSLSVKIKPGELFVSIAGTVGKPCITSIKCCIHDGFVYFPDLKIDPWWLFRIFEAGECYRGLGKLGTQLNLNTDTIGGIKIPVPPPDEIQQILAYLDRETTRIDTLIEEQKRLIEVLRERRVATIAEALDGYEMTRLRRLVDSERPMTYGILQCGEPVEEGVPYIGPSDITGEGTSPEREVLRTTTPEIASSYQRSVLAGGDVVVSIGPAYGKVAVVSDDLTGANLTQDTVRVALRPELVDTRFIVWSLLSRQTSEYWDYQIMGATFRRLNLGTLARTPIPLPPIDVQRRIANYLDEQTARIDLLIAEAERFIELSKERRSALITTAVTGQIDAREMV